METTAKIYDAIPKIMADVGAITKSRKNQQQGYSFRGIDDVLNACQPSMIKHGVFVVPEVTHREQTERATRDGKGVLIYTTLTVKHTFYATDGSHVIATTIGEAMDSGDKSANKAMSAAMKYAMIETFSIPTEENNDTENETHAVAPAIDRTTFNSNRRPATPSPSRLAPTPAVQQLADHGDLMDDANFEEAYLNQFKLRDFTDDQIHDASVAACKKFKVVLLNKLDLPTRKSFIAAIAGGKLDKYKAAVAAGV